MSKLQTLLDSYRRARDGVGSDPGCASRRDLFTATAFELCEYLDVFGHECSDLRAKLAAVDSILGSGPTLIWGGHTTVDGVRALSDEVKRQRETIAQWEATAAAQGAAIERLRQRQPSDLEERDRTFSRVMPAMDLPRRTRDLRERLGE